jgi:hypothetical protein
MEKGKRKMIRVCELKNVLDLEATSFFPLAYTTNVNKLSICDSTCPSLWHHLEETLNESRGRWLFFVGGPESFPVAKEGRQYPDLGERGVNTICILTGFH